jgi:hypothetical protein
MSLWTRIRDRVAGASSADAGGCCIVDGRSWVRQRGPGLIQPRDMIFALQQLGRLGAREGWTIEAVFEGEPLRKAGDGEAFDGGAVAWYSPDRARACETVCDRVRKTRRTGGAVAVATDDPDLERALAGSGATCLRTETLRKATDGGSGEDRGGGPRGGGSGGSGGRRRGGRRGGPGRAREPREREKRDEPKAPADAVRDLIDVVE